MPSITKARISSPLEAGCSLLDSDLPSVLTDALEYVSARLAKKKLHLSLIVVRKEVSILSLPSPESPSAFSTSSSPSRSLFSASTFTRTIVKRSSNSVLSDTSSSSASSYSRASSPTLSIPSSSGSVSSSMSVQPPNPWGISLLNTTILTEKEEKVLRKTVLKTEKKFSIGSGWLSTASLSRKTTSAIMNDLVHRSLIQNQILFSSEGLTLLSLDHLYTFKYRLNAYSTTFTAQDLTLAVDALRRLVLVQQGRRVTKGYLMRAYSWLTVSLASLVDINEGYKTAYGGQQRLGGIEVHTEEKKSTSPPVIKLQTNFAIKEIQKMNFMSSSYNDIEEPLKTPELSTGVSSAAEDDMVAFGESAKGRDLELVEDRGPHKRGPVTPNGFEDITPVTKGEWCFLMVGDGWNEGRKAAIETC